MKDFHISITNKLVERMGLPKNCTECIHYHDCTAGYYGAYMCRPEANKKEVKP